MTQIYQKDIFFLVMEQQAESKNILATLPSDLEEALRTEAKQQERSRNAQLVWILKERYAASLSQQEQRQQAA